MLFLDGHKSHVSLELHDFCMDKQKHMYCFIPHASHIMQPCYTNKRVAASSMRLHYTDNYTDDNKSKFCTTFLQPFKMHSEVVAYIHLMKMLLITANVIKIGMKISNF